MKAAIAVAILLAGLFVSPSQIARQTAPGTAMETPYCGDCWMLLGQPVYTIASHTYEVGVTYYNGFDTNVTGTVNLVIDSLNQTVGTDATVTTIPAGQNRTLHPSVDEPLPPGKYSTFVYATLGGNVISNVTSGSFQQRYSLLFQSFAGSSNDPSVTVGLTNVSPVPVQGILGGYVSDASGNVLSIASQNITVAANSSTTADLVFQGNDGNTERGAPALCSMVYTYIVFAPNGTALSPLDHETGSCSGYVLPMTPPVEAALGAFQTLETNVTNGHSFSLMLVVIGQIQDSNSNEVAVTTSTLTLGAGQASTGYLTAVGLPCGGYTVQISVEWVAQSPLPPGTPQFSPESFDAPLRVC